MVSLAAFDDLAATYDDAFTTSAVGCLLRAAVWRRLDAQFRPGDRVLELNCGTGADAIHLAQQGVRVLATDLSDAMLDVTRRKVAQADLAQLVQVAKLDIADLAAIADQGSEHQKSENQGSEISDQRSDTWKARNPRSPVSGLSDASLPLRAPISNLRSPISGLPIPVSPFTGILSNFGGLNCVADLAGVARGLGKLLEPGGRAILCLMGPWAPWEWVWYLRRGQIGKAFRRLQRRGVAWRGLTIRYPSIAAVRRAFAPRFTVQRVSAIGALLPPSYAEPWAVRHPALLARLNRIERRLETAWPLPWLADHYLIEMVFR